MPPSGSWSCGSRATPDRLREWLGDDSLPVSVREGASGLAGIRLEGAAGEILLGADPF